MHPVQTLIIAGVADRAPHHRIVLLLDKAVVVFAIRARAREAQFLFLAVGQQILVDELGAVVTIDAEQRKGQFLAHFL